MVEVGRGRRRGRSGYAARPPAAVAAERIGRLGRTAGAVESYDHALWVWEGVRRSVVARSGALQLMTRGGGRAALEGQVDLSLLHHIGGHLNGCTQCWEVWADGYRPGVLLTAAVRRRPAGAILRAIESEQRAKKRSR